MANNCCPTCGCPQHCSWSRQGMGGGQWAGPAWGGPIAGPPMPGSQWYGPMMQAPGPGMAYGPAWGPPMNYGPQPGYPSPYYGALPSDAEIEEMIYDTIDADPFIPFDANIDVTVDSGTVYLRGEVQSKRTKHAAGDDAWWIPGVVDVHNDIAVQPRRRDRSESTAQSGRTG